MRCKQVSLVFLILFSFTIVTATETWKYNYLPEKAVSSITNGSTYNITVTFANDSDKLDGFHASYFYPNSNPFNFTNVTVDLSNRLFTNGSNAEDMDIGTHSLTASDINIRSKYSNFIPTMTSASTPSGNIVTTSNELGGDYYAWKAFQNQFPTDASGWSAYWTGSPEYIQIQLASSYIPIKYTLISRSEGAGVNREPSSWTLYGSTDGTNWDVLDSQTGITWTGAGNEVKDFTFTNTNSYSYFKIIFTASTDASYIGIGTVKIYEFGTGATAKLSYDGTTIFADKNFEITGTLKASNYPQDLTPYWKSDGSSTVTGDWNIGSYFFTSWREGTFGWGSILMDTTMTRVGYGNTLTGAGNNVVMVGDNINAGDYSVVVGSGGYVDSYGVGVGRSVYIATYGTGVGMYAFANDYAVSLGYSSFAADDYAVSLGYSSFAAKNSIAIGSISVSPNENQITFTTQDATYGSLNAFGGYDQLSIYNGTADFFGNSIKTASGILGDFTNGDYSQFGTDGTLIQYGTQASANIFSKTTFKGNVTPQATNTYDLGNSTRIWNKLWVKDINATGTTTLQNTTLNNYYGEMWNKLDAGFETVDLVTQDVYVQVKNLTCGENNGVSCSGGNLTVLYQGLYKVDVILSSSDGASGEHGFKIFLNETGQEKCYNHEHSTTTTKPLGISCYVRVNSTHNKISLRIDDHQNPVNDINLYATNVNILRIGN